MTCSFDCPLEGGTAVFFCPSHPVKETIALLECLTEGSCQTQIAKNKKETDCLLDMATPFSRHLAKTSRMARMVQAHPEVKFGWTLKS